MKSFNRSFGGGLLALAGFALACTHTPTPVEMHWGEAAKGNAAAMVANPEAGTLAARPLEGIDPVTGELVLENYQRNQTSQETRQEEIFLIEQ